MHAEWTACGTPDYKSPGCAPGFFPRGSVYSAGYRPCLAYLRTPGAILHRSRPRGGGRGGKCFFFFFNGDAYSQPKEFESQSDIY